MIKSTLIVLLTTGLTVIVAGCGAEAGEDLGSQTAAIEAVHTVWSGFLPDRRGRDHFYTDNFTELQNAGNAGWTPEFARFNVADSAANGATLLHRFWDAKNSDHFYTIDPADITRVLQGGAQWDEPATWHAYVYDHQVAGTCPVYRGLSPAGIGGTYDHFYTMDGNEMHNAINNPSCTQPTGCDGTRYAYERIAFYAYPYNNPNCPHAF